MAAAIAPHAVREGAHPFSYACARDNTAYTIATLTVDVERSTIWPRRTTGTRFRHDRVHPSLDALPARRVLLALGPLSACAADYELAGGKLSVKGSLTAGAGWRTVSQDTSLVANVNSSQVGITAPASHRPPAATRTTAISISTRAIRSRRW